MILTRNKAKKDDTPLQYGRHRIKPSKSVVYVGVAIDEEL